MILRIFDTQREEWLDLDQLHSESETKPVPALPESCPDCGAHFAKGEAAGLREHQRFCASAADGIPLKDEHGNTVGMLGDPDPAKLARHVQWYGPEGAEPWLHLLEQSDGDGGAKAVFAVSCPPLSTKLETPDGYAGIATKVLLKSKRTTGTGRPQRFPP